MNLSPSLYPVRQIGEEETKSVIKRITSNIYYTALTVLGEVGITLSIPNAKFIDNSAISSQLYLGRLERLIRAIEDWMQIPLDLQATDVEPDLPHVLTITPESDPDISVNLHLPIDFIASSAENNGTLDAQNLQLHWTNCHVKVVLGHISVPDHESALITPQATVLIPQSFEQLWQVSLKIPKAHAQVFGQLQTPPMNWTSTGRIERYISEDPSVSENEIVTYCEFSMEKWLFEANSLNQVVNQKLTEQNISFYCSDGRKVIGMLLPIGNGAGIRVTQVIPAQSVQEL